jgi:hypothetical protein
MCLALRADTGLPTGARVILELPPRGESRAIAEVVRHAEGMLELQLRATPPPARHAFPPFRGWLHVRARVGKEAQVERWLAGDDMLAIEHAPHPEIEVSDGGIAFDHAPFACVDELLLLSVGVPHEPGPQRAVGRVTQVRPLFPAELRRGSRATHRTYVEFDARASHVLASLVRYGERVQRAFLDLPDTSPSSRLLR